MMLKTTRNAIIKDLLRARPRGPVGRRVAYTIKEEYDYDRDKYKNIPVPSDPQWGYTDEELFSLELRSHDDVQKYVLDTWFEGKSMYQLGRKKATVTRRVNKLWNQRIEDTVRRVSRKGGAGIYNVRRGYYSGEGEFGHIYAASKEEAQRFAEMFFGYLISDGSKPRIEFVRFGSPKEVIVMNARTVQAAAEKIKDCQTQIAALQKKIEVQGMWLDTLSTVEQQQLAAED